MTTHKWIDTADPTTRGGVTPRIIRVALVQADGGTDRDEMLARQLGFIRDAAASGAQVVCLQELAFSPYFCESTDPTWFAWAEAVPDGRVTRAVQEAARRLHVVVVAPLYESAGGHRFNTAVVVDADGTYLGKYRKVHIPDAPGFRERFYFEGGDGGFPVFDTAVGRVGVYICHDRHYPEGARALGLQGAEIVFVPSATSGSASEARWQVEQRATAIANGYFVGTINRTGREPTGTHLFFGRSYFADPFGEVVAEAGSSEQVLIADLDLSTNDRARLDLPVYETRRPETYGLITDVTKGSSRAMTSGADIVETCKRYSLFEWTSQDAITPLPIARAKGVHLWDLDGNRYLDWNSISMNVNIGHGDRRVTDAVVEQMGKIAMASPSQATDVRAEVSRRVAEVTPVRDGKVFFTLGGADANETAIRIARLVTGRRKILARERSYHGGTHLALSMSGDFRWRALGFSDQDVVRIPDPYMYRPPFDDARDAGRPEPYLDLTQAVIDREGADSIAAVIVEPITGSNGLIVPPVGWLSGLRALCDKHGVLLVCDEVMSGFGRTGKWFAVEHEAVTPDIVTMAKGLTSGYMPLGAVVMSGDIASFFDKSPLWSGLTLQSHPVALAAARANLDIYESDKLIERAAERGQQLLGGLEALRQRHPSIGDVRGVGLFAAIELVADRETKRPLYGEPGEPSATRGEFAGFLQSNGLLAATRGSYVFSCPPLVISAEDVDRGLEVLDHALDLADHHAQGGDGP